MNLNLEPKKVFDIFKEIAKVPRCSGDEKRISDFLVKFAKDRNLEVIQDEALNVIIKKDATPGYENALPVILQGHMDMVCVKEDDSDHDFSKDPIELVVDGDFLKANKTTLGADDGLGVAMALAVLDSNDLKHPALEVLVTTSEETTMDGAANVDGSMLRGKRLLNIDSEEEGRFTLSSAGGAVIEVYFEEERQDLGKKGLRIDIDGLEGGHSGQEIARERANANKLLFRILDRLREKGNLLIGSIMGGSKQNAIPSIASAEIYLKGLEKEDEDLGKFIESLVDEYQVEDPGLNITLSDCDIESAMSLNATNNFIDFGMIIPDGVLSHSKDIEGLVETSINDAVIMKRDGRFLYELSLRSSKDSKYDYVIALLKAAARRCQGDLEITNTYPSWEFEKDSDLQRISAKTYKEVFNKEGIFDATHAGLECGMLKAALPDCEMISFGPDIFDAHSPKERASISSTQNMWKFTVKLLENLK
ncbi:aminoacyl-histidine dipeptidase [Peptoniphilus catoniae]|uniref:aminoacyl-histidine dipeptidase n=1 Tax=Peptoniphilus catoniae TaxID=1660341 RepID=UPI0010FDEDF4|nr:aminoacyl-histidine dipeptidase [Peptoniphilus catoniae]